MNSDERAAALAKYAPEPKRNWSSYEPTQRTPRLWIDAKALPQRKPDRMASLKADFRAGLAENLVRYAVMTGVERTAMSLYIRTTVTAGLMLEALTELQYRAALAALDGGEPVGAISPAPIVNVQPARVTFGPGSVEFKMDAPINDITVRPLLDASGDREVVRNRAGQITGIRRVDHLS